MEIITKIIYRTDDGTDFETKEECIVYEVFQNSSFKPDPFYEEALLGKIPVIFKGGYTNKNYSLS